MYTILWVVILASLGVVLKCSFEQGLQDVEVLRTWAEKPGRDSLVEVEIERRRVFSVGGHVGRGKLAGPLEVPRRTGSS